MALGSSAVVVVVDPVVSLGIVSTTSRGPCKPVSRLEKTPPLADAVVSTKLTLSCTPDTSDVTSTAFQARARTGPEATNVGARRGAFPYVIRPSRQSLRTSRAW